MMIVQARVRTPEQRSRKLIREERTIMDLQMAIKKEEFRLMLKTKTEFDEGYEKVDEKPSHGCWL